MEVLSVKVEFGFGDFTGDLKGRQDECSLFNLIFI